MLVYRIEDRYGEGPYRADANYDLVIAHGSNSYPTPYQDGIIREKADFCATSSMEGLHSWFIGWIDKLKERGYFISTYKVPKSKVKFGQKQVVFDRRYAKLVDMF